MQRQPMSKNPGPRPRPRKSKGTVPAPAAVVSEHTGNMRYLVLDFERHYKEYDEDKAEPARVRKYRYQVYLLPAGGFFEGFGGSRSGLLVGKTPSMVVRTLDGITQRDVEYNLAAKGVWQHLIAEALTNFSVLHNNGAKPRDSDGMFTAE